MTKVTQLVSSRTQVWLTFLSARGPLSGVSSPSLSPCHVLALGLGEAGGRIGQCKTNVRGTAPGHQAVYRSGWLYPVYIFSFISLLRIIFTPQNPLLNSLGILLQDLPFIFVRLSLIIALGTITPILGLCKNVLVTLSYVYFNYLTRYRIFSTFELSSF